MNNKNLEQSTVQLLKKNAIYAKKKFGQNFLIDQSVIKEIIEKSDIKEQDLIIEIGPGLGNLTEELLNTGAFIIAFEIDNDMVNILKGRFKDRANFLLINEDILKVDIEHYIREQVTYGQVKVIANLPYYITTPIIFKLLETTNLINQMIIMVQKEVADRITATTDSKDYGVLTVNINYYGSPTKIIDVPNSSFMPSPNVDSSVVKINIEKRYDVKNEKLFFDLVKSSFSGRRKKISNSLENSKFNNMNKQRIKELLSACNIADNARAENISIEKFVEISNRVLDKFA